MDAEFDGQLFQYPSKEHVPSGVVLKKTDGGWGGGTPREDDSR